MGIFPKNYVCNAAQVIYHIAYTLGTFLQLYGKNGFRSFLTNGRTDFCLNFANFRNSVAISIVEPILCGYSMGMGTYNIMLLLLGGGEYCFNCILCIYFY